MQDHENRAIESVRSGRSRRGWGYCLCAAVLCLALACGLTPRPHPIDNSGGTSGTVTGQTIDNGGFNGGVVDPDKRGNETPGGTADVGVGSFADITGPLDDNCGTGPDAAQDGDSCSSNEPDSDHDPDSDEDPDHVPAPDSDLETHN